MGKHISVFLENIIMFSKKYYSGLPNDVPMETYFCFLSVEWNILPKENIFLFS
jgi:hypothetical protein